VGGLKKGSEMTDSIKVEISQDSVQQIIAAKVQAAVAQALTGNSADLIEKLVAASLCSKSKDEQYRYGDESKKPTVLEHIVRTMIAEEARKGILAWAESHREQIAEKIRLRMASKKWTSEAAVAIADQLVRATEYRFKLEVQPVYRE
jgi:hypothetical protein